MASTQTPRLVPTEWSKQLHVKGKPFLMLAGELQNSSLTSSEYMDTVWRKMKDANINTLLGCVTWEDIEPEEGVFDFSELDKVILGARKHDMHLVLLWFGSFKNGISSYTPAWVKKDISRFPRAMLRKAGGVLETSHTLSVFYPNAVKADATAFTRLMSHLKEFDEAHSTVIMVQVENETGLLGDYRDGCESAEKAFDGPVPEDLVSFLSSDYDNLHVDMKALNLAEYKGSQSSKTGTWTEVFGSNAPRVGELFQAYHYAKYLDELTAAGRKAYDIPLYTNAWMNYVDLDSAGNLGATPVGGGGLPGDYPSGGPVSNVLDIWQKFAPHIDFFAPDIYLNDYDKSCERFRHRNQPLFIPEQRRDEYGARRVWIAFGSYAAMGTGPFGIDTVDPEANPFTKHYGLLKSVAPLVLEAQRNPGSSVGFCFDEIPEDPKAPDTSPAVVRTWDGFEVTIERCFVFGKPGTGSGMVIHRGGGKFLLIGWGFQVRAKAVSKASHYTGILHFEEKIVEDAETGKLKTGRVLNGDETRSGRFGIMPNEDPDYGGFPICVTIPARTMIAEIEFYSLE